jgi:VanZ family protein
MELERTLAPPAPTRFHCRPESSRNHRALSAHNKVCLNAGNPVSLFAVSKARSFLKYWLPLLIWMTIIFSASGDPQSFQRSSRIIGPLLRWLFPHMPETTITALVTAVRKCAHLTEYAILAWLFWRARRKPVKADARPWSWREAGVAILFVAAYALTDEFHQRFVPGREASFRDVLIDTAGALWGILMLNLLWRWRHGSQQNQRLPNRRERSKRRL